MVVAVKTMKKTIKFIDSLNEYLTPQIQTYAMTPILHKSPFFKSFPERNLIANSGGICSEDMESFAEKSEMEWNQ